MPATGTDRIDGLTTSVAVKAPCVAATTANITLSGLQTVGGVALAAGYRVLVKDQTDQTQNGIYVADTSTWQRARDFDGIRDAVQGTLVIVVSTTGLQTVYRLTTTANPVVFGTSSIVFEQALFGDSSGLAFLQSGTGAVSRNMQTKMREQWFSVKDFNAQGDDATDETVAFQACHDAMPANGSTIFIPAGTYRIATWNISKPCKIIGTGPNGSFIKAKNATGDVLNITATRVVVQELGFDTVLTRTNHAYVKFALGANQGELQNFYMQGYYFGVQITADASVRVANGSIRDGSASANGAGIYIDGGNDHFIDAITMDANPAAMPSAGIRIVHSGATLITNVDIIHHTNCLLMNPGNGQSVAATYVINSYFDTATRGIFIDPSGTGIVIRSHFIGVWTSSHTAQGVLINSGGGAKAGFEFTNHHSFLNGSNGIQVEAGPVDVHILGGEFAENVLNGIAFAANASSFSIIGVRSGTCAGLSMNGAWGILISAGTSDNYRILDNDVRLNTTGGISNGGSGATQMVRHNLGYKTENAGAASILSGTTAIVINHGLAVTPEAEDFWITLKENPTNDPGIVYIDTITATQATIRCRADPGASNLDLGWGVQVNQ